MPSTASQVQLSAPGAKFTTESVPIPTPEAHEVSIRVKATALNPVDWKNRDMGIRIPSWPTVLGVDVAGVVEAVGDDVQTFKPGDEVFSLARPGLRSGGFQEVVTVPFTLLGKKPSNISFEEAASLPLGFFTAAASIVVGLHVDLPFTKLPTTNSPKSILVLGGSSSVGAAAIQLLRLVLPSATILTTSAATHHARLQTLGATQSFSRAAQDEPAKIKAATPGGLGVDAIIDPVGAVAKQPAVFDALNPNGLKLYSQVATGATVTIPEGVTAKLVIASELAEVEGGRGSFAELAKLMEQGKYQVPIPTEVVGQGLGSVNAGLEKLKAGVSGTKYVITL